MKAKIFCSSILILLTISLLSGCSTDKSSVQNTFTGNYLINSHLQDFGTENTRFQPNLHPKLALVLGGGGLRGYAHIGVLQALEEAGIRPDIVVGTSVGSIIGAAYASGHSPHQIWEMADSMQILSLADVSLKGPGFVRGLALARWADSLAEGKTIEQFPLPFAAVATDLNRALAYVITRGNTGQALRASAAIPGVFLPVEKDGMNLVDGGVSALVPVNAARALGADMVIAVDIYCHGQPYPANSALLVMMRVAQVQSCQLARPESDSAEILITPIVASAGINDAEGREAARRQGYEATIAQLPAIRSLLKTRSTRSATYKMNNNSVNSKKYRAL